MSNKKLEELVQSLMGDEEVAKTEEPEPKKPRIDGHTHEAPASLFARPVSPVTSEKPSDSVTGVSPEVISICATLSKLMYNVETKEADIEQATKILSPKFIKLETHGELKNVVPPFAYVICDECIILAWRGSKSIMDWASNASFAPVSYPRWSSISKSIKAHSAYVSLVECCTKKLFCARLHLA
jgi:hypothetical protein